MTISASNFTFDHIPGVEKNVTVHFYTTDPGVIEVTYPPGITGPATVTAAGSRVRWATTQRYLAIPNVCQSRVDCTWLFEVDWENVQNAEASTGTTLANKLLIGSIKTSWVGNRYNWAMNCTRSLNGCTVSFVESLLPTSTPTTRIGPAIIRDTVDKERYAITKKADGELKLYARSRISPTPVTFNQVSSETMGVDEVLIVWGPLSYFAKILHICNDPELDNWLDDSVIPTTDQEIVLPFNHEMAPSPNQKFYDISGNNYDPYELAINEFQAPGAVNYNTDTGFTSPMVEIPITVAADCAPGVKNITLRRNRVGIPTRTPPLSDAELYDDGAVPVTVVINPPSGAVGPVINARVKL